MVQPASAAEQPRAWPGRCSYTALLHLLLCTACAHQQHGNTHAQPMTLILASASSFSLGPCCAVPRGLTTPMQALAL
jgi:hypothetical protein